VGPPPDSWIDGVDDSKQLKAEVREALDVRIRGMASGIGIGVVEPGEVDRLNVYHAGIRAMQLAVEALPEPPQHVLVDSRTIPDLEVPQNSFTKGDGLDFSIACASIVAKVHRDRLMVEMDRVYPGYGFASHKGYCSSSHQDAVRRLGPCPIHRRSFDFIRELCGEYAPAFYELKSRLGATAAWTDLEAWYEAVTEMKDRLPSQELRKLRILGARRRKALTPG
jgi:ribonuclease HII